MNGGDGDDTRGINLPFRQSALKIIKTMLMDYYPAYPGSLDELATKFEHKVFLNATSRDDYLNLIEQKLTLAKNMFTPSSVTGNQNTNIPANQPTNNYPDSGNSNPDTRGLDKSFRLSVFNLIKTKLMDYHTRSSSNPACVGSLDEIANKFEHKIFVNATSRDDYLDKIKQKLTQAANMFPPPSDTRNQNPQTQRMACTNVTQNIPTGPVLMNQPMISSSTINPGFSSGSVISTESMKLKSNTQIQYPETRQPEMRQTQKLTHAANMFPPASDTGNQNPQTQRMACKNVTQNIPTGAVLMNQPVVSSSTINPEFSSGSVISTEPMDLKSNTQIQYPETRQPEMRQTQKLTQAANMFPPASDTGNQNTQTQRMACTNVTQNIPTGPVLMNQPAVSSLTINPGFSSNSVIST